MKGLQIQQLAKRRKNAGRRRVYIWKQLRAIREPGPLLGPVLWFYSFA